MIGRRYVLITRAIRGPFANLFRLAFCFGIACFVFAGCTRAPRRDLLQEGEKLCLNQQWVLARDILKTHLVANPYDAGAHYYLARCYLASSFFRPAIAEGELRTALKLFLENDRESTIERFDPDYFELICHVDLAKVQLRQIDFASAYGASYDHLEGLFERCTVHLEAARAINPDAAEIDFIEAHIQRLKNKLLGNSIDFLVHREDLVDI